MFWNAPLYLNRTSPHRKKLLFLLAILLGSSSPLLAQQQSTQTKSVSVSSAEKKKLESDRKEAKKRAERELKERNKLPAWIRMAAPAEKVRGVLIELMATWQFKLSEGGDHRLVFEREVTGTKGMMTKLLLGNAYSSPPMQTVIFTVSQVDMTTRVEADMSIQVRMALGNVNRVDQNKEKNWRPWIEDQLLIAKERAEAPARKE